MAEQIKQVDYLSDEADKSLGQLEELTQKFKAIKAHAAEQVRMGYI